MTPTLPGSTIDAQHPARLGVIHALTHEQEVCLPLTRQLLRALRQTADDQPVLEWARFDRVVWVPLQDGRAFGVEFRDPAAFAKVFGAFAVAACGGPEIVRARAAAATYPEPRPMRARPTYDGSSWPDLLDIFS